MIVLPPPMIDRLEWQFGVVARCQLLDHLTRGEVDGLVTRGVLTPLERGAYRLCGSAVTPEQDAMAAALRARPNARVTGPFVLGLLDAEGFTPRDPFEVLTAPTRRLRHVGFPHRRDPTPDDPLVWFAGLPIVTPAAAFVDACRWLGRPPGAGRSGPPVDARRLRVAYDSLRWKGLTTTTKVLERARRLGPSDPGARFVLDLLADQELVPESEPERDLGRILRRFDPAPEPQVWVTPSRRVDWFWRPYRMVIEHQGEADHTGEANRAADKQREIEFRELQYQPVYVFARDLDEPEVCARWLEVLARRRAAELGVPPPRRR